MHSLVKKLSLISNNFKSLKELIDHDGAHNTQTDIDIKSERVSTNTMNKYA